MSTEIRSTAPGAVMTAIGGVVLVWAIVWMAIIGFYPNGLPIIVVMLAVGGEKITLTDTTDSLVNGIVRNFVRVRHAAVAFTITTDASGTRSVEFRIPDYLRTRETVLYFIPVSPRLAPAYKTLKEFSEYVRNRL